MFYLDLQTYQIVNDAGFIRVCHEMNPRFELASDKYYRDQLAPTYDKIKAKLMEKVATDNPASVAFSIDGWSAYFILVQRLPTLIWYQVCLLHYDIFEKVS